MPAKEAIRCCPVFSGPYSSAWSPTTDDLDLLADLAGAGVDGFQVRDKDATTPRAGRADPARARRGPAGRGNGHRQRPPRRRAGGRRRRRAPGRRRPVGRRRPPHRARPRHRRHLPQRRGRRAGRGRRRRPTRDSGRSSPPPARPACRTRSASRRSRAAAGVLPLIAIGGVDADRRPAVPRRRRPRRRRDRRDLATSRSRGSREGARRRRSADARAGPRRRHHRARLRRRARRRGHDVAVVDPAPGSGASHAAAGHAQPGRRGLARRGRPARARRRLRAVVAGVRRTAGRAAARHRAPCWSAWTPATSSRSSARRRCSPRHGEEVEVLDGRRARVLEPALGRVTAAAVLAARPCGRPPGRRRGAAARARRASSRGPGRAADATVLATGARLPAPYDHLVRGVRGEILRLRGDDRPGVACCGAGCAASRSTSCRGPMSDEVVDRRDLRGARRAAGGHRRWRAPPAGRGDRAGARRSTGPSCRGARPRPPRHPRQPAARRPDRRRRASSSPPGTSATACCSRRSPRGWWPTPWRPAPPNPALDPRRFAAHTAQEDD